MVTNYRRGYAFEWKIRKFFRDLGFMAERQPGSKPFDIIVFKEGRALFVIDTKKTKKDSLYLNKLELRDLIEAAEKWSAQPLIIYSIASSPPYVGFPKDMLGGDGVTARFDGGDLLKDFIEDYIK